MVLHWAQDMGLRAVRLRFGPGRVFARWGLAAALALAAGIRPLWAVQAPIPAGQGGGAKSIFRRSFGLRPHQGVGLPPMLPVKNPAALEIPAQALELPLPRIQSAFTRAEAPNQAPAGLAELQAVARLLPARARLSQEEGEGTGSGEAYQSFGQFWDGDTPWASADEEALVLRRQEEKEEARHAYAEPPVLEHGLRGFSKELAREILDRVYSFGESSQWTGRQLLELLMTEGALDMDRTPDVMRLDMSRFGRSDAEIREILKEKGIPVFRYQDFMNAAFRRGLLYRVNARKLNRTFHGVPALVRQAFGFKPPEEPGSVAVVGQLQGSDAKPSAFSQALSGLAREALAWPVKDELFEFSLQLVEAALAAKRIDSQEVSALRGKAPGLAFEVPSLPSALITLLESSKGRDSFDRVLDLCQRAVAENLLKRRQLDETLEALRY